MPVPSTSELDPQAFWPWPASLWLRSAKEASWGRWWGWGSGRRSKMLRATLAAASRLGSAPPPKTEEEEEEKKHARQPVWQNNAFSSPKSEERGTSDEVLPPSLSLECFLSSWVSVPCPLQPGAAPHPPAAVPRAALLS